MRRRAIIYARISQDRSGERVGVTRQLELCRELAGRHGLSVDAGDEIVDNDVSAYRPSKRRPGWEQVVCKIRDEGVDAVVVFHPDRLYRHPVELEELVALIEDAAVQIHTCTAGDMDLSTPSGRLVGRMLGATARHEVEHKAERQAAAARSRASAGRWNGGRRPLGYESDGVTICEPEAQVLREAARRLLAGHSLAATTRWASEALDYPNRLGPADKHGQRQPRGTPLSPLVLRLALTRPRAAGLRQYWPQSDRRRQADKRREERHRHTPEIATVPAQWPALLPEEDWLALRKLFSSDRRTAPYRPVRDHLLSGLIVCGHPDCQGVKMYGSSGSYSCSATLGGCGRVSVSMSGAERLVAGMTRARLEATELELLVEPPPATPVEAERRRLKSRFDALLPMYDEGIVTADELLDQRRKLSERLAELDRQEDDRAIREAQRRVVVTTVAAWDEASVPERATVLRALIERVVVRPAKGGKANGPRFDPNRVRVEWRTSEGTTRGDSTLVEV